MTRRAHAILATDAFGRWLAEHHYAERTITAYLGYSRRACAFVFPLELHDAGAEHLRDFLRTVPASPPSQRQARKALVAYFAWALDAGLSAVNVAAGALIAVPDRDRLPRPLDRADFETLLATAQDLGGEAGLLTLIFGWTGCRFEEVRRAQWADLELGAGGVWRVTGKGARRRGPKLRVVPLRAELVDALRRARRPEGFVFGADEPYCGTRLRSLFSKVTKRAGLEGVTPHRIRHTVATVILEETGNLRLVQELLGHSSVSTTELYTRVLPGRLRQAVTMLPGAGELEPALFSRVVA